MPHVNTVAASSSSSHKHVPHYATRLEGLIQDNLSNNDVGVDEYELVKHDLAKLPRDAQKLYFAQVEDARDNDGTPRAYEFALSEMYPGAKGSAFAVRWTSEDGEQEKFWLFNAAGKKFATGSTMKAGTDLTWENHKV